MLLGEAFKVNFDGNRAYRWLKVEQSELMDAQPVCYILCVGQRSR